MTEPHITPPPSPRTITQDCDDCPAGDGLTLTLRDVQTIEEFDAQFDEALEATRTHLRSLGWVIAEGDKMCPDCAAKAAAGVPRPPEEPGFGIRHVGLFCDSCRTTIDGDFRADTKAHGLAAIRAYGASLGWVITEDADLCPLCAMSAVNKAP